MGSERHVFDSSYLKFQQVGPVVVSLYAMIYNDAVPENQKGDCSPVPYGTPTSMGDEYEEENSDHQGNEGEGH